MMPTPLAAAHVTYRPFPPVPELAVNPSPIKDGIYGFSSTGFTVMGHLPKKPSELVAIMTAQYEEREYDRFGREVRGGPGRPKGKEFFRAHLSWYGIEFAEDEKRDELEDALWDTMTARPLPSLPDEIFAIESAMRLRWLEEAVNERARRGYLTQSFSNATGFAQANSLTDNFFDNPRGFFQTHFPPGVSRDHVIVLTDYDTIAEHELYEWATDTFGLFVEKVDNNRGVGRDRGRFIDFVVGKDIRTIRAKADEMRGTNNNALGGARVATRPY